MKNSKYFFLTFLVFAVINTQDAWSDVNDTVIQQKKMAAKLSDYGFFDDLNMQSPTDGVLPYQLITPLFSDYADKLRFVYIPTGGFAEYVPDKVFDFPEGSVLIKTFGYLNSHEKSNLDKQLLETRLLIKKDNKWKNVSYVWNEEQNDAYLNIAGKTISTQFINENGDMQDVRYRVPNINQCKECHQSGKSIQPIGPKARNLNSSLDYDDGSMNQLLKWHEKGWIDKGMQFKTMEDWANESASLEDRTRAYLDINCGHCHIDGGSADTTGLYLDFTEDRKIHLGYFKKPIAAGRASNNLKYSIVPGKPEKSILFYRMQSLDPGIMMPESGRALEHKEAISLVEDWIKSL
ncbi:MAG: SO2930 family diheme c-type cytochrome [SAR86 cluster bacterium]|nr:SO2930 family diheme c-type cytochrome [SAR86 cluster bacterium]